MGYLPNGEAKMSSEITNYFKLQRQIFGMCPKCNTFFRLSDLKIYSKGKPLLDWMDKIDLENDRLTQLQEKIDEQEDAIRQKEREKGRLMAQRIVKKIDPIFAPRKLSADDAKVLFHPIDYVVFNGMNSEKTVKDIIMLDKITKNSAHKKLQDSIEYAIEKESYEWQTIRVGIDGKIVIE
jgi:predicted Holliday junction resolvase-like endonuclease